MKIKIKSIYLDKVEGKPYKETILSETFGSETAWMIANSKLIRWAKGIKAYPIGHDCYFSYEKVDFKITWEDGEEYDGRYDLHANEHANIGKQIKRFLEYLIKNSKNSQEIKTFMETHEIYVN